MEAFLVLVLIALAVWVVVSISKKVVSISKSKKDKTYTYVNPIYQPGSFRGELGSPGTSPTIVGRHSSNCECNICLYGHDPDKGHLCPCRSCEGYRRGKPLH
jgi:hypothetical protein